MPKQALGRGLKALIPDTPKARSGLAEIPVDRLRANPAQPRRRFDADALAELADSIARYGVLQPLLVSDDGAGGYLIIAGERRWRAASAAGVKTVPAVIRERVGPRDELALALVENLQRRDLSPLEEARAFEHLRSEHGQSQADIAAAVGRDRSTIANALRLLRLPERVQEMVETGQLSAGHARALLAFRDRDRILVWAERVRAEALSVRELERAAAGERSAAPVRRRTAAAKDPNLVVAEERLGLRLGAPVTIRARRGGGGAVVINCKGEDELMRVFDLLVGGE
ncbi:MAG: ParB/RepB/Spo0J family partition protein [Thermoanaerobaculales bacterium]|jgi:ParB family chromosome partitioning protein|nr:ParB/RepB/Spo0J family partition protein [Thermoanaerobaculales bacterium]